MTTQMSQMVEMSEFKVLDNHVLPYSAFPRLFQVCEDMVEHGSNINKL